MRFLLSIVLIGGLFYWLSGKEIVSFDNVKAKQYINTTLDRIESRPIASPGRGGSTDNVDREVNSLCTELKDLSGRAMRLREKLLANVIKSTNPKRRQ